MPPRMGMPMPGQMPPYSGETTISDSISCSLLHIPHVHYINVNDLSHQRPLPAVLHQVPVNHHVSMLSDCCTVCQLSSFRMEEM